MASPGQYLREANAEAPHYRWPFVGLVGFMFVGATGNILVCMAVWRERRLQTATNYFLLSLAVADLLVCTLVMPFGIIYEFYGRWPFDWAVCNLWVTCDVLTCSSSILHMCFISVGRYLGIRNPLHARQANMFVSRRAVLWRIAIAWVCAALIASPITMMSLRDHKNIVPQPGECAISNKHFLMFGSLLAFFIPMFVMVPSYVMTVRLLSRRAKFVRQNSLSLTSSQPAGQSPEIDSKQQNNVNINSNNNNNSSNHNNDAPAFTCSSSKAEPRPMAAAASLEHDSSQPVVGGRPPTAPRACHLPTKEAPQIPIVRILAVPESGGPRRSSVDSLRRCESAADFGHDRGLVTTCYAPTSLPQLQTNRKQARGDNQGQVHGHRPPSSVVTHDKSWPGQLARPSRHKHCRQFHQQSVQSESELEAESGRCQHKRPRRHRHHHHNHHNQQHANAHKQHDSQSQSHSHSHTHGHANRGNLADNSERHLHHHHHHHHHHHRHRHRRRARCPHRPAGETGAGSLECTKCTSGEPDLDAPTNDLAARLDIPNSKSCDSSDCLSSCPGQSSLSACSSGELAMIDSSRKASSATSAAGAAEVSQLQQQAEEKVLEDHRQPRRTPNTLIDSAILVAPMLADHLPSVAETRQSSTASSSSGRHHPQGRLGRSRASHNGNNKSSIVLHLNNSIDRAESAAEPQMIRYLGSSSQVRSEQKATKVLGVVFFTFVICWTPFFVINFTQAFVDRSQLAVYISNEMMTTFLWLGYISSTINPVIYTVFNRNFRRAFRHLITCQPSPRQHSLRFNSIYNKSFRCSQYQQRNGPSQQSHLQQLQSNGGVLPAKSFSLAAGLAPNRASYHQFRLARKSKSKSGSNSEQAIGETMLMLDDNQSPRANLDRAATG